MLATILQRIYQQLLLLVIVAVVLLAAYVSAGRQFMPAISRYADFLEAQIFEATGIPVSVDSLTGSFSGFNPVINIDGLRLAVGDEAHPDEIASSAVYFDQATIEVDMGRSIWLRRWVLEEFVIESLELDLQQNSNGGWQLTGVDVSGNDPVDLGNLYQTFLSFSRLDLRNVAIAVQTLTGETFNITNGLATIQNQGNNHFLHINANLQRNAEQVAFSMEVQGDELSTVAGRLHGVIPTADYSPLLSALDLGGIGISELTGAGEFWIDLNGGDIESVSATVEVENVTLSMAEGSIVELEDISGSTTISRGLALDHWEVALSDMAVTHGDEFWRDFNSYVYFVPQQILTARADQIEVSLLADLALSSGMLDDAARQQLLGYAPGGSLQNFSLTLPLGEGNTEMLSARTNIADLELGSVSGSPNLWGMNGYAEVQFDPVLGKVTGLAEVESENFSMNIPNTFTRVWDFDYVNGRLHVDVDTSDGQRVRLMSSAVIAQSPAVDGRVKFNSFVHRHPDGERDASLELVVGAEQVDAQYKALFLPDGPGVSPELRSSMEFLESAILGGDIRDSGILFRGSTLSDADPISKTFQSFFLLDNGEMNFSDEWPDLEELSGLVLTDDNNVDVDVAVGSSLGVNMQAATGEIRRDTLERNWLSITGKANGATAAGLNYLQATPVDASLKETFSSWQAEGDFSADINVLIPLNQEGVDTDIRLDIALVENNLVIPEFDLSVADLTGPVVFDTRTGLEESNLTAELFGDRADVMLSSDFADGSMESIYIAGNGRTNPEELIAWPRQSEFVRDLLAHMDGEFNYEALMTIDQTGLSTVSNSLLIDSDLVGTSMNLPRPLTKSAEEELALSLQLDFDDTALDVTGSMGSELAFQLAIDEGNISSGLLNLGYANNEAEILSTGAPEGLVILGNVNRFELEEWTDFIASLGTAGETTSDFGNNIAFIDIETDQFSLYGEELPDVRFRIVPDSEKQGWNADVDSESVRGTVVIPYSSQNYLDVDLEFLHLPGDEEDAEAGNDTLATAPETQESVEEEAIDPLLNLDPRQLPLMQFATNQFSIGSREYGSWEFTLIPTADGADFEDLNFDFRGLRLGRDEPDERIEALEPHFRWNYDGETHSSELVGVLIADNIGAVLQANGYAPSLESARAVFVSEVDWPGSPAFFSSENLSGRIDLLVENGRFNRNSGGQGALRLVSFINLSAVFQRLRFSDDLLRRGLAYDEITGKLALDNGLMHIEDRLVISGPSSLYQITGDLNLADETIEGEMFVTLPVSNNLPWIGLLTANIPLAVGAYLFDQIFGDQVDSLSSAVYTLSGPFEGLQPSFKQAFGSPDAIRQQRQANPQ